MFRRVLFVVALLALTLAGTLAPRPAFAASLPSCWTDTGTGRYTCYSGQKTGPSCWWDNRVHAWACPASVPTTTYPPCWTDAGTGQYTCYSGQKTSASCWWDSRVGAWGCPVATPTPAPAPSPTPSPTPAPAPSPAPDPSGWTVAYTTTFGDLDKWQSGYYWGDRGGNGELETYQRAQVQTIPGGGLTITADHVNGSYPSGLITTKDYQTFGPGIYASATIKIPAGQGLWPAWWLLSTQNNIGNKDELDILEEVGYQPNVMYSTLHTNAGQNQAYSTGPDLTKDFHTYSMWWESGKVIFYLDGQPVATMTKTIPQSSAYLILNLAVGGSWPGNPDSTTPFPAVMTVKSVTVWTHGATLPSAPPA